MQQSQKNKSIEAALPGMANLLLVHTDEKFLQLYTDRLKHHYKVHTAVDGLSAVRKTKIFKPRMVVSEYNLPILSGLSILKYLRSNPDHLRTPFIFVSASVPVEEALNLGANDWINPKHHDIETIINKIHSHIKNHV